MFCHIKELLFSCMGCHGIKGPGIGIGRSECASHSEVCLSFFSSTSSPQEKAAGNLGARL